MYNKKKNKVLACFQTRPQLIICMYFSIFISMEIRVKRGFPPMRPGTPTAHDNHLGGGNPVGFSGSGRQEERREGTSRGTPVRPPL